MMKIFIVLVLVMILGSCSGTHINNESVSKQVKTVNNNVKNQKSIDSQMAVGDRPDSGQAGPTFKEVLADRISSYNKVEYIDKMIVDGKDTIQLHETYYCLHDSSLFVPKQYLWGGDKTKDFRTNNFATKIVVICKKDTVLNKVFERDDFNSALSDQLKKFAIIFDAGYLGYNKEKEEFALSYSISIPLTDLGVPAYIIIDKKGNYKILDEYANMDAYKKN